jgi:hypothetical protein
VFLNWDVELGCGVECPASPILCRLLPYLRLRGCGVSRGYLWFLDHEWASGVDLPWDAKVFDVVESAQGELV